MNKLTNLKYLQEYYMVNELLKTQVKDLDEEFYKARRLKLDHDTKEAIKEVDEFLSQHDNYEVTIGTYDYDGYNADRRLNGDGRYALQDITGSILVSELIDYYMDLDYNTTAMIEITVRHNDKDYTYYALEYNGYELFYNLIA
jgi:hypothetical protein